MNQDIPAKVGRSGKRWLLLFVALLIIRITLKAFGFDALDLPLQAGEAIALVFGWQRIGWHDGYRAALARKPG